MTQCCPRTQLTCSTIKRRLLLMNISDMFSWNISVCFENCAFACPYPGMFEHVLLKMSSISTVLDTKIARTTTSNEHFRYVCLTHPRLLIFFHKTLALETFSLCLEKCAFACPFPVMFEHMLLKMISISTALTQQLHATPNETWTVLLKHEMTITMPIF